MITRGSRSGTGCRSTRSHAPASNTHAADLFGLRFVRFEFHATQLNTMDWWLYLRTPNPITAALMDKMRIAAPDRSHVKAQCARMIATFRLDPAEARLVAVFMNAYMRLGS